MTDALARLQQRAWIPALALLLALLLIALPPIGRVERLVDDFQQSLAAKPAFFHDAVVVDIDEASLRGLKPYLGEWPYERDIYALLLDYLTEHGASAVVFDILLTDSRPGDEVFARSLRRNGNGVLAAATPAGETRMTEQEVALLARLRRPVPAAPPRATWPSLLLPNATLLDGAPNVSVGVASAVVDPDGVVRRMPVLHEARGNVLPTLPLAAIEAAVRPDERLAEHVPGWPIDDDGFVHLYFPSNANAVLTLPFQDVAEAALGRATLRNAAGFFRGKTVFIGSTAYLADRVTTPRGTMSGTYTLALMHQTLQNGLAWKPPRTALNVALVAVAVVALGVLLLLPNPSWQIVLVWTVSSVTILWAIHLGLLAYGMQQSALLPPLLVLVAGWGLHAVSEQGRLRRRAVELQQEADLDSLTGLPVRRSLLRVLKRDLAAAHRHARPLAVALLDLDHFKMINDTFGHATGDEVLKAVAGVLRQSLRATDSAGRWGGEEFVVLMPDTDNAGAAAVLEKIRQAIAEAKFPAPAQSLRVTASAGFTQYKGNIRSPEDLLDAADRALYKAKEAGRDCICVSV